VSGLLITERLIVRPWKVSDATSAFAIFSAPRVARWLAPAFSVPDSSEAMRSLLLRWQEEDMSGSSSVGHWALQTRKEAALVGGLSLQYVPADGESVSIAWVLAPSCWGKGYAAEAGEALIRWAMHERGVREIFAVLQPDNTRAVATAKRIGMDWVAERGHLNSGRFQVYRLRHADLGNERPGDRNASATTARSEPMPPGTGSGQPSSGVGG
jgi:[ribosomal protein S5]-alanine N-acetyltransferase